MDNLQLRKLVWASSAFLPLWWGRIRRFLALGGNSWHSWLTLDLLSSYFATTDQFWYGTIQIRLNVPCIFWMYFQFLAFSWCRTSGRIQTGNNWLCSPYVDSTTRYEQRQQKNSLFYFRISIFLVLFIYFLKWYNQWHKQRVNSKQHYWVCLCVYIIIAVGKFVVLIHKNKYCNYQAENMVNTHKMNT